MKAKKYLRRAPQKRVETGASCQKKGMELLKTVLPKEKKMSLKERLVEGH
jgi:hypothetical protein